MPISMPALGCPLVPESEGEPAFLLVFFFIRRDIGESSGLYPGLRGEAKGLRRSLNELLRDLVRN